MSSWLGCALLLPVAFLLQDVLVPDLTAGWAGEQPLVRLAAPLMLLWLLLVWSLPGGWRWRVVGVVGTALLAVELAVPAQLVAGASLPASLREVAATAVQALVTLAWLRWRVDERGVTPREARDVVALLEACAAGAVLGSLVAVPLGPATLVWALLGAAWAFIGVACVSLLVHRRLRDDVVQPRPVDVLVVTALTCLTVAADVVLAALPLSWLVLLPAVLAGLTLGPWVAAAFALAVCSWISAVQVTLVMLGRAPLTDLWSSAGLATAFAAVTLVLSLGRDQRERLGHEVVRRRQAAQDQAGLLQTLLESISEALVLLDREGTLRLHNRAAVALLGEDRLRSESRKWVSRPRELPARFSYPVEGGPDEGPRILSIHLAPVQFAGAESIVAVARDTTVEHQRIEELTSFAAVAAHDLKTPLTAVMGWLEVAEESVARDPEAAAHAVRRGLGAARRMTSEIEDWLAYTVAREGELSPETVALAPLLAELAATYDAELRLRAYDVVVADRTLLRHLLANLVGNAVKYTRPGERPDVTVISGPAQGGWVQLQVVDRGIGIPAGEETTVFEPFRRSSSVDGAYEGSGLGLALCKRIVRRHGGSISAQRNSDGPGTTINVTLPAPRTPVED